MPPWARVSGVVSDRLPVSLTSVMPGHLGSFRAGFVVCFVSGLVSFWTKICSAKLDFLDELKTKIVILLTMINL